MTIFRGVLARRLIWSFIALAALAVFTAIGSIAVVGVTNRTLTQVSTSADLAARSAHIRAECLILTNMAQSYTLVSPAERPNVRLQIFNQKMVLNSLIDKAVELTMSGKMVEFTQINDVKIRLSAFYAQTNRVIDAYDAEQAVGPETSSALTLLNQTMQAPLVDALSAFELSETDLAQKAKEQASRTIPWIIIASVVLAGAAVSGTMFAVWQAVTRIVTPLQLLQEGVEQLQQGRLDNPVQVRGRDEMGMLAIAFNTMAAQLQQRIQAELAARQAMEKLNVELEQRVAQRTMELETSRSDLEAYGRSQAQTNEQLRSIVAQSERRAQQLQTSAEVARAVALVHDPDALLPQVMQSISEHFGYYHAGVLLLDEAGEWAVLRAASSEGGQTMLARGHKLRVGVQGIVGWTAQTGQPRIALDVGADAVHFDNPLLPDTRSEIALPLKVGERILGVLDVQSTQEAAFSDEDVSVLQALADQLAITLENARLFQQTQAALNEAQEVYRRYIQREWAGYVKVSGVQSQEYSHDPALSVGDAPLPELDMLYKYGQVLALNDLSSTLPERPNGNGERNAQAALVAPIKLRDQVIGALDLREMEGARQWTPDEIALADAVATQVALALENARLFEDATNRAQELAVLNDLAQALTTRVMNVEEVLDEVYKGTSRLLDTHNFYISLYTPEKNLITFPIEVANGQVTKTYDTQSADQGLTGYLIRTRAPLLTRDTSPQRLVEMGISEYLPFAGRYASKCWLGAPLLAGDQVLGTMACISYTDPNAFGERDKGLLTAIASQTAIALQNAYLFEQTQARVRQLSALNEISRAASGLLESEQLLSTVYEQTQRIMKVDAFFVGVYNPDTNVISYPLCYDEGHRYEEAPSILSSGPRSHQVITTGEPILVEYSEEERAQIAVSPEDMMGDTAKVSASLMYVPMRIGARVTGVMSAQSYERGVYTQEHLNLLAAVANQVAVALENARLFEQTRQQVRDLETVNRVGQVVTSAMNLDQLLVLLYEQVSLICETNNFYVALYAPDRDVIHFPIYYEQGKAVEGGSLQAGSGLTGFVINRGQPVLIRTREELDSLGVKYAGEPCRSYLAVPMRAGERLSGVIAVQDYERDFAFDERHLRLLSTIAPQAATAIENTRLFEEARHRALQLATAAETGKAASALLDMGELLANVVELIRIRFGYYHASVFLVDDTGEYAVLRESTGEVGQQLKDRGHKLAVGSQSLVGWVTSVGRSRVALDTDRDAVHFKNPLLPLTRSELVIPLKRGERIIGALDVQSTESGAFSPDDVSILELLADQVAIAIENARLYAAEQRRAVRQAALYDVGRRMTGTLDPQVLMNTVVEAVQRDLGFERVLVLLADEQVGELRVAAASTNYADLIPSDYRQRIGAGMIGLAAQTGQTQRANDTHANPNYTPLGKWDPRSELCVPLKAGARAIGVLNAENDAPNAFGDEDARALESLADQLAVALENARLYSAEQQRRREAAALLDVARVVGQSLAFNQLMLEVARKVASAAGVDRCTIFLLDEARTTLRPAAAQFASGQVDKHLWTLFKDLHAERVEDAPLAQQAIRTGQVVAFDRDKDTTGMPRHWYEPFDIQSALLVSLVSKSSPIGVMVVDYAGPSLREGLPPRETWQFTPEQVTLLNALAAQSAMVIDNARMYEELIQTAERLRELDRLKSQFLANMSHELRTPLNSIIGFSRVILKGIDGPLTDMQKQDLEAIHASGQHLLGLINDILDISKIEAGKMELAFEEVDLRSIVKGVMSTAIGLVKDKPINLIQTIPDNLPIVWSDPVRARQILLNLVSNAAKFTEKGSITVEATADARFVRVCVRDTGIGIPEDKRQTIFEAFTQADTSTTRKYGGTGLGLAISRRFVELHGGAIWVESEVGAGTAFYFTLPRAKPAEEPEPSGVGPEAVGKKVVVAIDDDPGVITLYRRYLEQHGYHVIGVSNSQQAIEQVQRFKPHAITLDILMPQKDGWTILQELKENAETRDIPVVICSIISDQGKGFSLGATDYLVKPIMQDDLVAALRRLDGRTKTTVLVIDDRPEDILLIRRMLEAHPQFVVSEAHSGAEGLDMVYRDKPDLILLDLMMPEMDGFTVLEMLRSNPATRETPVIVITAKTLTQEDRERLNSHMQALLAKGTFNEKDLLNDVVTALGRMTSQRQSGEQPPAAKG